MKKTIQFIFICAFSVLAIGCYSAEKKMYIKKNNSGELFLSHYTSLWPSLGPCGFSRPEDSFIITVPRTSGKIPANELKISTSSDDKYIYYTGYIEFINNNKVVVALFKSDHTSTIPLSINGRHTIRVEPDEIYKDQNK